VVTVDTVVVLQMLSASEKFYGKRWCYKCDHMFLSILSVFTF